MRAKRCLLAASAAIVVLAGCSSGGGGGGNTGTTSTSSSSSTSSTSSTSGGAIGGLSVDKCFAQEVEPGVTVQSLLTRDTLRLDLTKPGGFPNGRRLQDPVIDLTLAYLFTDLSKNSIDALAKLAINPPSNADNIDAAGNIIGFSDSFPFVNQPHGPVKPEGTGSNFNFRANPASDYEVIDAMGNPAVATILVQASLQPSFNQNTPADYAANGGKYLNDLKTDLVGLSTFLKDDFNRLSFTTCAQ